MRRERLSHREPVHVTVRFDRVLPSMRKQVLARIVMVQIRLAKSRFWRITQFSIQATHLHLVVEVENEMELGRGMKGLGVRIAKNVNRALQRKGCVVSGRYHTHVLRTPREARNAIAYVILNSLKHGSCSSWDPWSSAAWFDDWSEPLGERAARYRERVPIPVATAQTWLLSAGWKQRGLISSPYRQ